MKDLILIPVICGVPVWLAGVILTQLFKRRLKRNHPELADEITRPLLHKSMATDLAFLRFIFTRHYRSTGDKLLI